MEKMPSPITRSAHDRRGSAARTPAAATRAPSAPSPARSARKPPSPARHSSPGSGAPASSYPSRTPLRRREGNRRRLMGGAAEGIAIRLPALPLSGPTPNADPSDPDRRWKGRGSGIGDEDAFMKFLKWSLRRSPCSHRRISASSGTPLCRAARLIFRPDATRVDPAAAGWPGRAQVALNQQARRS